MSSEEEGVDSTVRWAGPTAPTLLLLQARLKAKTSWPLLSCKSQPSVPCWGGFGTVQCPPPAEAWRKVPSRQPAFGSPPSKVPQSLSQPITCQIKATCHDGDKLTYYFSTLNGILVTSVTL